MDIVNSRQNPYNDRGREKSEDVKKKLILSLIFASLLLVLPGQMTYATPTPPYILVNESTHECYITILGDECYWCDLPQGWKVLNMYGPSSENPSCPTGFTKVAHLDLACKRYKIPFCCGVFSSQGDCADMVINATQQACAFVPDVNACILPAGWSKRPADVPESSWGCNFNRYHWVDDLTCLASPPTSAALVVANVPLRGFDWLPLIGIALILLGALLILWMRKRLNS
jgi:hypothetical protein